MNTSCAISGYQKIPYIHFFHISTHDSRLSSLLGSLNTLLQPTSSPSHSPPTSDPTKGPSQKPVTISPSLQPTDKPVTGSPSMNPTPKPVTTNSPSNSPTKAPVITNPPTNPPKSKHCTSSCSTCSAYTHAELLADGNSNWPTDDASCQACANGQTYWPCNVNICKCSDPGENTPNPTQLPTNKSPTTEVSLELFATVEHIL